MELWENGILNRRRMAANRSAAQLAFLSRRSSIAQAPMTAVGMSSVWAGTMKGGALLRCFSRALMSSDRMRKTLPGRMLSVEFWCNTIRRAD